MLSFFRSKTRSSDQTEIRTIKDGLSSFEPLRQQMNRDTTFEGGAIHIELNLDLSLWVFQFN